MMIKFKYFSLKYNLTSKSVKFFIFWTCRPGPNDYRNVYDFFECRCLFCFLALKKGNFWENPTLVNRYLLPVAMVTKLCKTFLIFYQKCIHLTSIYITAVHFEWGFSGLNFIKNRGFFLFVAMVTTESWLFPIYVAKFNFQSLQMF